MMFFCAALLGIPGTGNFIGEILILIGAFAIHPIFVTLATVSLVMAGLYSLMIIYHALFGQNTTLELVKQNHGTLKDLGKRELVLLLLLAIGLVWLACTLSLLWIKSGRVNAVDCQCLCT